MKGYSIDNYDIQLKPLKNKKWELIKDFSYTLSNDDTITIPKGFKTDLSSVPKILWSLFPPFGNFLLAALVHDYLYVTKYKNNRAFADREMLYISNALNSNKLDNYLRYYTVVLFGWIYWDDKNANE
jgi:hypothetical protein